MSLDEPQAGDHVETINGIQVAMDATMVSWTGELVLDYKKERGNFAFLSGSSC
ncbi:hypothetical protein R4Z10_18295 [Niallia sp. XMNu-256]|uniref:hypothetical protein n=1 Tax=Niallia sp. XMNu-256 TaxID=3082444 RepID=UPI0030CDC5B1